MTEHEELLMLRELAAKQKQELEEKDRIIEEKNEKIQKQKQTIGVRHQCGQLKQLDSMTNSEIRVLKFFIA